MHVALAAGESLVLGTSEAIEKRLADERVAAVLLPLVPRGDHALARAARRYLAAWDGRFLHSQNFYAPASRVATRAPASGPRNADAAPALADALARGGAVEALAEGGVSTGIADDLAAWNAHFRAEGAAWAVLAARDARFESFAPAPWARHNLRQAGRRGVEILQASRRVDPLVWALHLARESSFTSRPAKRIHS